MSDGRPPPPPARPDSHSSLAYYHPNLRNMEQVKQVLTPYSKEEGWFLLRNSISKPGVLTISVVHSSGIKHFNVESTKTTPTSFYLKDIQFSTLDQLVRYYSHTDVPNKELIAGVQLKFPIPRAAAPYLSVYDDDYQRRSASPGDVYLHPHPEDKREESNLKPPSQPAPQPPSRSTGTGGQLPRNKTMQPQKQQPLGVVRRSATFTGKVDEAGYSQIDNLDRPHAQHMMRQMQQQDDDGEHCDCGLSVEKSRLPRGWSIHLSQDEESFGEVYFMSPNRETSWTLPLSICLELDAEQQDFIRDRIYDFEQRTKRTARAKLGQQTQAVSSPPGPLATDSFGYIKPSPSPTPSPVSPSRPASVFPPRHADEEEDYMCMNGSGGKQ